MRLSWCPRHTTRTACALIVMPRSRSSSIESSTCSRISRSDSVWVSSRMRSASVDLPWSMCATIEKLRILPWGCISGGSSGPADERQEHVQLADPDQPCEPEEDGAGDEEAEADRGELRAQGSAQGFVECQPGAVRRARGKRGCDRDAAVRGCECAPVDAPEPAPHVVEQLARRCDVDDRGRERDSPDPD